MLMASSDRTIIRDSKQVFRGGKENNLPWGIRTTIPPSGQVMDSSRATTQEGKNKEVEWKLIGEVEAMEDFAVGFHWVPVEGFLRIGKVWERRVSQAAWGLYRGLLGMTDKSRDKGDNKISHFLSIIFYWDIIDIEHYFSFRCTT